MKKDLKIGGEGSGINHEIVRYYDVDFAREKFFDHEAPMSLRDWKDLVSQEGMERIKQVIQEEIFKKLGS